MTRIFYTDGAPEPEQPPDHHDPPLGRYSIEALLYQDSNGDTHISLPDCDCHYPFDGDGWVLCDAHKEEG